jgi:Uma2 family endonuclease
MTNTLEISTESSLTHWQPATWQDYLNYRDDSNPDTAKARLFFNRNQLLITDMSGEGINHSGFNNLLTMIFVLWFIQFPEQKFRSLGGCLLEKPEIQAVSPDLVLYLGENSPVWQEGESRYINLNKWRVPDLVGEISDTTLATDLDEKKQLYAALEIPEYWVISVRAKQVLMFILQENGKYLESNESQALFGLRVELLNQTLEQLDQGETGQATRWFYQQIQKNTSQEIS